MSSPRCLRCAIALGALLTACAGAPPLPASWDVLATLDSDDPRLATTWSTQPSSFDAHGHARPPEDDAWRPLPPASLTAPRGGQRASMVWYRARFTRPDAGPLTLGIAVDDYAEVVVDGVVVGHVSGYNGVVYAPLGAGPVGAEVTVLVLGINAPLGAPPDFPWWFVLRNEVFVRTPVRLLRGDPAPVPPAMTPSMATILQPATRCRVGVQDRTLSPPVQARATCAPPDEAGPRWLRFDVEVAREGWLHVVGEGYAEVWVDGALAADFAEAGAGSMSPPARGQRVHVDAGRRTIDVLVWPSPIARPDATAFPDPTIAIVNAP